MSGRTGLSVNTPSGKRPITVSNTTMNPKLNAQYVGGFQANGLGRVALASNENFTGGFPFAPQVTLSITAPAKGFVRLEGRVGAFDGRSPSFCFDCEIGLRVRDVATGATSPMSILVAGAGNRSTYLEIPTEWVFPVAAAGEHTYALDAGQVAFSGGPFALENPVLVGQYVPFGATDSATSLGAATTATAIHRARNGVRR